MDLRGHSVCKLLKKSLILQYLPDVLPLKIGRIL